MSLRKSDTANEPLIDGQSEQDDARRAFRAQRALRQPGSNKALPSSVSTRIRQAGAAMYSAEGSDGDSTSFHGGDYSGKGRLAYFIFVMLGVGLLFPFNAFITAFDYFHSLYPNFPFEFVVSLAYNYPSLLALFLSIRYGPKFSFTTRTLTGLLTSLVALGAVPLITNFTPTYVSLPTVMTVVFLSGVAVSIMFGGVLGLAAIFPPRYITAVMIGQGVAGMVVMLLSIIARLVFPNDKAGKSDSAYLYFSLASAVLLACIVLFFVLLRLPITRHYHSQHLASQRRSEGYVVNHGDDAEVPPVASPTVSVREDAVKVSSWAVFKRLKVHAFSVFMVFFVTLALFPGIVTTIKPNPDGSAEWQDWFVVASLSMFMVGDWAGRTTPSFWVPKSMRFLWLLCLLRMVFFPLFSFCISPHYFTADWIPLLIGAAFAYSNGLFSTWVMMIAPTTVEVHERETAGLVMSFMLNCGIFCGAHVGLLVLYIVTGNIGLNQ